MSFDLATLDTLAKSQIGADMEIIHPANRAPVKGDNGQPLTITLLGRSSDVFQAMSRRIMQERVAKSGRGINLTQDDIERENVELLTACTVRWTEFSIDGTPFPWTPDNARRLWSDPRWRWLSEAAFKFIHDDGNFLAR
jgi:hypothetical protein